ncbi:hypothetical protein RRG08_043639 [Elysia crispata]|uniref:Uncharacterized protein n=1 Tax=Elysia crispata TaxID=231223 RepID=A0AAE0ZUV0_9GAST|nr:hypothetical protein RRG08_043639 [Elysia crispata]
MALNLTPPGQMSFKTEGGHLAKRWKAWNETMVLYINLAMKSNTEKERYQAVLYIIGEEGRAMHKTWIFPEEEQEKVEPLLKKFEEYCMPKTNVTLERYKFNSRYQKGEELIDEYLTELKKLSQNYNFGLLENELLKDRIVVGVNSTTLKERILREYDLTLEKALDICRAHEQSSTGLKMINPQQTVEVDALHFKKKEKNENARSRYQKRNLTGRQENNTEICSRCGSRHGPWNCPVYGKNCRICQKPNHFAKQCRSRKLDQIYDAVDETSESDEEVGLGAISAKHLDAVIDQKSAPWTVDLKIQRSYVTFKVDTGADITCITNKTYEKLKRKPSLKRSQIQLTSPGGHLKVTGEFVTKTHRQGSDYEFKIVVLNNKEGSNLLSRGVAEKMGLVKHIQEIQRPANFKPEEKKHIFGATGLLNTEPVQICMKENTEPYCLTTARRVPFPLNRK